jgi:hypothetical protein
MKNLIFITSLLFIVKTLVGNIPGSASSIGGPVNICTPATGIIFSTDSIAYATSYVWNLPSSAIIIAGHNTSRIVVNFSESTGAEQITVFGTNQEGSGTPASLQINLHPYPGTPAITPAGPVSLCNSSVDLNIDPLSLYSYCWYSALPGQKFLWQNLGIPGFTADTTYFVCSVFGPGGELYVAYQDYSIAKKLSVMKFNGSSWEYVGNPGITSGEVYWPSMAVSPSGELYIVMKDYGVGCVLSALKYDGMDWVNLDLHSLQISGDEPDIAISSSGQLFIAFSDFTHDMKLSVMKYDGSNWSYVGMPGCTPDLGGSPSIALNPDNVPYVAYCGNTNGYRISVVRFTGNIWENVGNQTLSENNAGHPHLVFGPDGLPCVGFSEQMGGESRPSVIQFDGLDWEYLGEPGFGNETGYVKDLTFDASGKPNVAISDIANNMVVYVMTYSGNTWNLMGSRGFTPGGAILQSLNFSLTGTAWVTYIDYSLNEKLSAMYYGLNCLGDSSLFTVYQTGTYSMTISNPPGCTDTASNNVIVNNEVPSTPIITLEPGKILHSSVNDGNQWFMNGLLIPGAINQDYEVALSGEYSNVVTWYGCSSDTSNPVLVMIESIDEFKKSCGLTIFPSPNHGKFRVSSDIFKDCSSVIQIYDLNGVPVYFGSFPERSGISDLYFDLGNVFPGLYFMRVVNSRGEESRKTFIIE